MRQLAHSLIFVTWLWAASLLLAQTPATVTLAGVEGTVTVTQADGQQVPAENGMSLVISDTIETGANGSAVLIFSNGTSVSLQPETNLEISEFSRQAAPPPPPGILESGVSTTRLKLSYGGVVGQVRKLNEASTFEIETPVGVAGVRGSIITVVVERLPGGGVRAFAGFGTGSGGFRPINISADQADIFLGANDQVVVEGKLGDDGSVELISVEPVTELSAELRGAINQGKQKIDQNDGGNSDPERPADPAPNQGGEDGTGEDGSEGDEPEAGDDAGEPRADQNTGGERQSQADRQRRQQQALQQLVDQIEDPTDSDPYEESSGAGDPQ